MATGCDVGGAGVDVVCADLRREKFAMIGDYAKSDDQKALVQVALTVVPFALLWWAAIWSIGACIWLTVVPVLLLVLFTVRVFALMHECGHGSLFRSRWLNRAVGFAFGVIAGMPQYVWSQHHVYHHTHNGNWDRYRGPYATLSVIEYAALTRTQQRIYRSKCSVMAAPVAGFLYLIFNPRFTWLKGSFGLMAHAVRGKLARPSVSMRTHAASFETRYWKSSREYRHMLWNNLALLSVCALLCWKCGVMPFTVIYIITVSVAGGAGIVLFTVQHNFEHSYASNSTDWALDTGAIEGTSFLVLPRWLNWFTVNIGYHHVHHLVANIPNYHLVQCHAEYQQLFSRVTRIRLRQVLGALQCILWDSGAQRIISIAEYSRRA